MASVLLAGSNVLSRRRLSSSLAELRQRERDLLHGLLDSGDGVSELDDSTGSGRDEAPRRLLTWSELPFWQQHGSELIHTGYREASGSVKKCVASWFYLHNESVSIHSHSLGALIFLALPFYVFVTEVPPRYAVATREDIVVCTTYFLGVAVCFALSTAFHTLNSHSQPAYRLGLMLDVQGILVLMWSSTIPLIYYSFAPVLRRHGSAAVSIVSDEFLMIRNLYFAASTALAAACSAATFLPSLSGPAMGSYRAALFLLFGASSFLFPILHGAALRGGIAEHGERIGLPWVLLTAVCNSVGIVVYALRFPERWFPRRFDLLGASHQIMHIMVVAAALAYAGAVVWAFDARHSEALGAIKRQTG